VKPTIEALGLLVGAVRAWLDHGDRNRRMRVEIDGDVLELSGVTTELQRRLADEWIQRHVAG
jgi:hypothetical protein